MLAQGGVASIERPSAAGAAAYVTGCTCREEEAETWGVSMHQWHSLQKQRRGRWHRRCHHHGGGHANAGCSLQHATPPPPPPHPSSNAMFSLRLLLQACQSTEGMVLAAYRLHAWKSRQSTPPCSGRHSDWRWRAALSAADAVACLGLLAALSGFLIADTAKGRLWRDFWSPPHCNFTVHSHRGRL